jgi:hypothetical protein
MAACSCETAGTACMRTCNGIAWHGHGWHDRGSRRNHGLRG